MVNENQFSLHLESFALGTSSSILMMGSISVWIYVISKWHTWSQRTKQWCKYGLMLTWIGCLAMLGLGLIYYRSEKKQDVTDLISKIQQIRREQLWQEQGQLDEGLALFILSGTLILIGVGWCGYDLLHTKHFTWLSSLIYLLGWCLMCTVASLNSPTLLSMDGIKAAICFPSMILSTMASFWIPYQPHWAWPVVGMGNLLFHVGHSLAT